MGLEKQEGSSRINRYEHRVTAIGFDNLETLAKALNVPVAYLLAENAAMASAILALADSPEDRQADIASIIHALNQDPALLQRVLDALKASEAGSVASKSPREASKPSARKAKKAKGEG